MMYYFCHIMYIENHRWHETTKIKQTSEYYILQNIITVLFYSELSKTYKNKNNKGQKIIENFSKLWLAKSNEQLGLMARVKRICHQTLMVNRERKSEGF